MSEYCSHAAYEKIGAIYVSGRLIIWASGKTSHPSYKMRVKPSPNRIIPQRYELLQCSDEFITRVFLPTAYNAFAAFEIPQPQEDSVFVYTSEGETQVPLFVLAPIPFDPIAVKSDVVDVVGNREGGAMPSPFNTPSKLPVNLTRVFEIGDSKAIEIPAQTAGLRSVEVTGYSYSFFFDEAFLDALRQLPPGDSGIADKLTFVNVDSTGAEIGGIAGISRMTIKVSSIC